MAKADDHRTGARARAPPARRRFLTGAAAAGVALPVLGAWGPPACEPNLPPLPPNLPDGLFSLGVALGRSPTRRVRAVDPPGAGPARRRRHACGTVPVRWQVADDDDFTDLVADGDRRDRPAGPTRCTSRSAGCRPGRRYWYRFTSAARCSPRRPYPHGPAAAPPPRRPAVAVRELPELRDGLLDPVGQAADDEPDVVVYLGDYIYEGGISARRRSAATTAARS